MTADQNDISAGRNQQGPAGGVPVLVRVRGAADGAGAREDPSEYV